MRLVAFGRVVQPELLVFEQIAVVGQEGDAIVHFQCTLSFILEVADGIKRIGEIARLFQLTTDFHRLPLCHLVGHGHGFHRERIRLLYVHIVVARYECE